MLTVCCGKNKDLLAVMVVPYRPAEFGMDDQGGLATPLAAAHICGEAGLCMPTSGFARGREAV